MRAATGRLLCVAFMVVMPIAGCGTAGPKEASPSPTSSRASATAPMQVPASSVPSLAPSPLRLPTAPPAPSDLPSDPFLDQVVVTVTDGLRVRSQPRVADDSIKYEPLLPRGTRLKVLDGPISASGYAWYQIEPVTFDRLEPPGYGWVAKAAKDGEPWIALPTCRRQPLSRRATTTPAP